MSALPLLSATVIDSWSFPGWYAKFCEDVKRQTELFGAEDREKAVRDAVRLAVDDQLRAGADLISDGEIQRVDFNLGFSRHIEPERVSIRPDCGFWQTARYLACRKLKNMAEGVKIVRREPMRGES
jgi:methionine synthase II (cobalamin-independent)